MTLRPINSAHKLCSQNFSQLPVKKERFLSSGIAKIRKISTPNGRQTTITTMNGDVFEIREKNDEITLKINGENTKVGIGGFFSISKKPIAVDDKKLMRNFADMLIEALDPKNQIDIATKEKAFDEYLKKHGQ